MHSLHAEEHGEHVKLELTEYNRDLSTFSPLV